MPTKITKTKRGFKIERIPCITCGELPFGNEYCCKHSQEPMNLQFGLKAAIPAGVRAAWGARLIFPADLLHDRQSFHNMESEEGRTLKKWLNERGALKHALDTARRLAANYTMSTDQNAGFTLFEDETGIILGNPLASYGYLYVAAYLKEGL